MRLSLFILACVLAAYAFWELPVGVASFEICKTNYTGKIVKTGFAPMWIRPKVRLQVFDGSRNLLFERAAFFDYMNNNDLPEFFCKERKLAVCNFCAPGDPNYDIYDLDTGKIVETTILAGKQRLQQPGFSTIPLKFHNGYERSGWYVR